MATWKKAILLALSICVMLTPLPLFAAALSEEYSPPTLSAEAAILIELSGGDVVLEKNADARLPMASTTKIMTALTALSLATPDTTIVTDAAAVGVEGSSIYLCIGEELTLEQLLYALMLESANDAAAAIAIGLCGSIETFAAEMNRMAAEMGLLDTHFVNPHGLDDEEHYTTARELAIITMRAMEYELFRAIVSTRRATIPHAREDADRLLVNHNKMLRIFDGCIGVKNGFTKRSGRCLVSAAERDGVEMVAVTLNAPNDWDDHTDMLEYGFSRYHRVNLCEAGAVPYQLPIVGSATTQTVCISNRDALAVTLPNAVSAVSCVIEAPRFAYAPVQAGEIVGRVVFLCDRNGDGIRDGFVRFVNDTLPNEWPHRKRRHPPRDPACASRRLARIAAAR